MTPAIVLSIPLLAQASTFPSGALLYAPLPEASIITPVKLSSPPSSRAIPKLPPTPKPQEPTKHKEGPHPVADHHEVLLLKPATTLGKVKPHECSAAQQALAVCPR